MQGIRLIKVMHSEDIADHDRLKSLIDARRAEAKSDTEREGIDMFMDFEKKHRESLIDLSKFDENRANNKERSLRSLDDIQVGMRLWEGNRHLKKKRI